MCLAVHSDINKHPKPEDAISHSLLVSADADENGSPSLHRLPSFRFSFPESVENELQNKTDRASSFL